VKVKDKEQAAPVSDLDDFVNEVLDQTEEQESKEPAQVDSATTQEVDTPEPETTEVEKPPVDGFQKRIDKVTADKYKEKNRADELQKRIDALEAANSENELKKPKLDDPDIDYDDDAFDKATHDYNVAQGVKQALAEQQRELTAKQQKDAAQKVSDDFIAQVKGLGKADFDERANAIPNLPEGVASALMGYDKGAEMIYHLGSPENAEKAAELASMTPAMALMEIGKLSIKLTAKPEIKTSAAPEPIETLRSGAALKSDIGDTMSMSDWMAKYG